MKNKTLYLSLLIFFFGSLGINNVQAQALEVSVNGTIIVGFQSIDFGNVEIGTTKDTVITISNTGAADLIISLPFSPTGNYSVISQPISPIPPGGSTTYTVRFTPGCPAGAKSGFVAFSTNDPANLSAITLYSGNGTDVTPPSLSCPADVAVNVDAAVCTAVVTGIDAIITDLCSVSVTWAMSGATTTTGTGMASGQTFNEGVTTVIYTVIDENGNSATPCAFNISVTDNISPTLSCPASLVYSSDVGVCTATVTGIDAIAVDNCVANVTWALTGATTAAGTGNASGQVFNPGVTTVTYDISDANGNTAPSCSFNVTISDLVIPTLSCPADVSQNIDLAACSAIVNAIDATVFDNCGVTNISWALSGATTATGTGMASGQTFNVGTTTVTYNVNDGNGNSAPSCAFNVTIVDNELPTLSCPANISISSDAGLCSAVINGIDAVVSDNCGITNVSWVSTGATVSSGTGNASGQTFNVGITTITYDVNDGNGNSAIPCSFTITVIDNEIPLLSCPVDVTTNVDAGLCIATVGGIDAIVSDNCATNISWVLAGATTATGTGMASGQTFNPGVTTITYNVNDGNGNSAVPCSFNITVTDNELPVLSCPANIVVNVDAGTCTATVTGIDATATDNCSVNVSWTLTGATIASGAGSASGQVFGLGVTTVTYNVDDGNGNAAAPCSFTVSVIDNELPTLTCPPNVAVNVDAGLCSAVVNSIDAVATDNCSVNLSWAFTGVTTTIGTGSASGQVFNVGVTTVTYSVNDGNGNAATPCSFTVSVTDNEVPTLTCPVDITVTLGAGLCSSVVTGIDAITADNCATNVSWDLTGATVITGTGNASGQTFNPGVTTVTYNVNDGNGNAAIACSFTVSIVDTELPTLSCPADVAVNVDAGQCTAVVNGIDAIAADNCTTNISWVMTGVTTTTGTGMVSGQTFNVGSTTVTYNVNDGNGNSAAPCSFIVSVTDNETPTLSCPASLTYSTDIGIPTATVTGIDATVADNCATNITWNLAGSTTATGAGMASGQIFNAGVTTVTYNVNDGNGNSAPSCSFNVSVSDTEPPTLSCPANVAANVDAGLCSAVVNSIDATATDNSGTTNVSWVLTGATIASGTGMASGQIFSVGVTTVTYNVNDGNGNSAPPCSFNVTITDNELPTLSCSGNVVQTLVPASCSAAIGGIAATVSDNCGTTNVSWALTGVTTASGTGDASGQLFNPGMTTVTYNVDDGNGNSAIACAFTVSITDAEIPTLSCPASVAINTDAGICSAVVNGIDAVAADNCTTNLSWIMTGATTTTGTGMVSGQSFNIGVTTVTYNVNDGNGNAAAPCSFNVTVTDAELPTLSCPASLTVSSDAGVCTAVVNGIDATVFDNCAANVSWALAGATTATGTGMASGQTFNPGVTTVTYNVDDGNGNAAVPCSFNVTISDTELPLLSCPASISVSADAGICTTVVNGIDATVSDNCGTANVSWALTGSTTATGIGTASGQTFNAGITTVTYNVDDGNGNSAVACAFNITIVDTELPTLSCPASTSLTLGVGVCSSIMGSIDAVVSDNCGTTNLSWAMTGVTTTTGTGNVSGQAFNAGVTTVTYNVNDGNGNSAPACAFNISIIDAELPTLSCPASVAVNVDAGLCSAVVNGIDAITTDNCTPVISWTMTGATTTTGTGMVSGEVFNTGVTTVTYNVNDGNGNSATPCSFNVSVTDNELPTLTCPASLTVSADVGVCSAVVNGIDATVSDNCATNVSWVLTGVTTATGTGMASGQTFNPGVTTVTYNVNDGSGNSAAPCSFNVTVVDTELPTLTCPASLTTSANAGVCTAIIAGIDATVFDNCGTTNVSWSLTGATITTGTGMASGQTLNLGITTVTYNVDDGNGNSAAPCSFNVTVVDTELPVLICPANLSVTVDAGICTAIVTGLDAVVTDNCSASLSWAMTGATTTTGIGMVSGQTFNTGVTTVTYTAVDGSNNSTPCSFNITVIDNEIPTLSCPADVAVNVDAGACTAVVAGIDATVADNCGTNVSWIMTGATTITGTGMVSGQTFNAGVTTVTYNVNDGNGNSAAPCSFNISVTDNELPIPICQNITRYLDAAGNVTITSGDIDNGSSDACGVSSLVLSNTTYSCATVGTNNVTLVVTDINGNIDSCIAIVTIVDTIAPTAICQNVSIILDGTGNASIVASDLDGGSTDACSSLSFSASKTAFNCTNVGANNVTLFVLDIYGNIDSCTAIVTVADTTKPTAICQNITVTLDGTGNATITGTDIDGGSSDDCNIVSYTANPNTFTCTDTGVNNITLVVTDANGNQDSCVAIVTVLDTISPVISCTNITLPLSAGGSATITTADVMNANSDICGIATVSLSTSTFNCSNLGLNDVVLTATDNAGNTGSCIAAVVIVDTIAPIVVCQNITIQLDATGNASITANDINAGTTDGCGIDSLAIATSIFSCANIGANDVVLVATDSSGNVAYCTAVVTVQDTVNPTVVCQSIDLYLDATGNATINIADIDGGSGDACGIDSMLLDKTDFTCADIGTNNVKLIVTDNNGNVASCTAVVTVIDTINPVAICKNINVILDANGSGTILDSDIYAGTATNCNITSVLASTTGFSCANIGSNVVTLSITGTSGVTDICTSIVTVVDTSGPVINCVTNDTLYSVGTCTSALPDYTSSIVATDNCGGVAIVQVPAANTLISSTTSVQLTATDNNGNVSVCVFSVIVLDEEAPVITCLETQTQTLDANCQASLLDYTLTTPIVDNCDNSLIITQTPAVGTIYDGTQTVSVTISAEDNSGNIDTCTFMVNMAPGAFNEGCLDQLVISNLLTPNGDGKNDTWIINDLSVIENCKVLIFNRWNKTVFESYNYNNDWGGTLKGKPLPEGTYYYVIECGGVIKYKDAVTLIRATK